MPQQEIDIKQVPAVVKQSADKAVPGGRWTSATKDQDAGKVIYELEGKDAKGRATVVQVTADGKVIEVETEITLKEVPKPVLAALQARLPRFKPSTVFEVRQEGKVSGYDFEGRRPKDKDDIGVFVSADGKRVEIDEND